MNISRMLIVFLTFIALTVYIGIRGAQAFQANSLIRTTFVIAYVVIASSVFIAVLAGSRLPVWLGRTLETLGGYWIILFVYILILVLLGDVLRIINHYVPFFPAWVTNNYEKARLYYFVFVMTVLFVISLVGYFRFNTPAIRELTVHANHKVRKKDEIKIVMASDLHLGNLIRKDRLAKWVKLINSQHADIILLAGDIFDHNVKAVEDQHMDEELRKLNAPYGVYAILGNHDYYAGVDEVLSYVKNSGIMVLRDQWVNVDGRIVLIGRDDATNKERKSLNDLSMGSNMQLPRVVLDHQPLAFNESLDNEIDLHLSGHTHNGQIWPINQFVERIYELGYGYRKKGNTSFYVSSGIGLWGAPIRFGTRSEIVRIDLTTE